MNLPSLAIEPLSKVAFGPFGTVIERDGADIRMINEGTTTRFHALSDVDVAAEGGTPILSIFAGTPRPIPIIITMLERHPLGSQSFMPLSGDDWLVVVAPTNSDDSAPDFGALRCFRARGDQGVTYAPAHRLHPDHHGPGNSAMRQNPARCHHYLSAQPPPASRHQTAA